MNSIHVRTKRNKLIISLVYSPGKWVNGLFGVITEIIFSWISNKEKILIARLVLWKTGTIVILRKFLLRKLKECHD